MPRNLRTAYPGIALGAIIFVGLWLLWDLKSSKGQRPSPAETTLFLMVRTGPDLSAELLRETLELGLEKANCQFVKPVEIRSIPPAFFEELARLIGRGGMVAAPSAADEGVELRQLPTRGGTWELRLPRPTQLIRELTIEYRNAGSRKYSTKPEKEEDRLTLIVPGSYAVALIPDDDPVRYSAEILELGAKPTQIKNDWPQTDRFFAITIQGFVGDQQALFSVLQDKSKIGNPLKNIEPVRNFTFAFANLNSKAGKIGGPLMEGNIYMARVPGIEDREPRRVWMYFPLTREEAMKAREHYRKFGTKSLPEEIRREEAKPVWDKNPVTVDAKTTPRWFELVDRGDGRGFTQDIPLKDFRALHARYPEIWRLIVWEFDKGDPQAIAVQHPTDSRRVYVIEEEVKGLPAHIAQRGENEAQPPDKKP